MSPLLSSKKSPLLPGNGLGVSLLFIFLFIISEANKCFWIAVSSLRRSYPFGVQEDHRFPRGASPRACLYTRCRCQRGTSPCTTRYEYCLWAIKNSDADTLIQENKLIHRTALRPSPIFCYKFIFRRDSGNGLPVGRQNCFPA